nr:MAG TPA: endosialidase chaperone [Caudoviricetes sp.]
MKSWTDAEKAKWRNSNSRKITAVIELGHYVWEPSEPDEPEPPETDINIDYDIQSDDIVGNSTKIDEAISDADTIKYGTVQPAALQMQIVEDSAKVSWVERLSQYLAGYVKGRIWDYAIGHKITVNLWDTSNALEQGLPYAAEFYIAGVKGEGTTKFKTITAYDALSLFDKDVAEWYNGLNFNSLTLKALRESLCTYCGVEFESVTFPNDSMTISRTMSATSITGREILAQCCELCGCWPKIDLWGTNKLKWVTLGATSCETFDYSQYDYTFRPDSTREEYDCKGINAVVVRATEDDVGGHYPATVQDNPYIIQGNFLCFGKTTAELTTIAQNIYNQIANKPYRPHKTVITGRPYLEPGDKVTVKFAEGNGGTFDTYILKRTMTGEAALLDTYEAKGQKEHREQYGISQQIQQIQGRTNELSRTVDETVNTITRIEYLTPVLSKTDPSAEWTDDEKAAKEGYQWFDGTDLRIWDGAAWKLTIYPDYNQSTQPTNAKEGEYWYNPTTGEIKKLVGDTWMADSTVCIPTTWTQTMQTQLKITAEGVQSTVTKDNIISTINQSAESVSIDASKIDLTGYVTINSLKAGGTTQIDGGRITTGTVAAARIDVDNLYVKHLSAADGTFSGTLNAVNGTFTGTLQAASGTFSSLDAAGGYVHFGYDYISVYGVEIGWIPRIASQICIVPSGAGIGNVGIGDYYWDQVKANRHPTASSIRYKKNILAATETDFSDISNVRIVTFNNKNGSDAGRQMGVIAEELYKVFPYAVCLNDAGEPDGVEYGKLSLLAIEAIQKLEKRVKKLEERRLI